MRYKLSYYSDLLFYALCTFAVSFTALRYALKNALFSAVLSGVISLIATILLGAAASRKLKRRCALIASGAERKNLSLYLTIAKPDLVQNLFLCAIDGSYSDGDIICDDKRAYIFRFKIAPIDGDDVAAALKINVERERVILCCAAQSEAKSFAEDFGVTIWEAEKVYSLLKEKNLLPQKYPFTATKKRGALAALKKRFNRRLCPSLFFSGFFLLLFSFFTFYPLYYVVAGSVAIALSCACLFFDPAQS